MSGFLGVMLAAGPSVQLNGAAASQSTLSPTNASATLTFKADGTVTATGDAPTPWFTSAPSTGIGSSYWVRATLVSGVSPTGSAVGSWVALSPDVAWALSTTGPSQTKDCALTISIATDAAGANIVCTSAAGAYTIHVDRSA